MGAGAMNRKEPEDLLNDFEFIRYGITLADGETMDKSAQLDFLNLHCNQVPIIYKTVELADIDDDMLESLFVTMGHEYEIDGLIIEINSLNLRNALGREKNGNPIFARAWKGFEANKKTTILLDINWQVSKHGLYKPVGKLQPIELDGVTVSNVTLINARFIKENSIGIGSKVEIIRSGQVIPKITQVLQEADPNLPTHCYSCKTLLTWNENEVELCCANPNCPEQRLQKIIAFFTILEVENLAQGIIEQLYHNGYDSVEKVLKMTAQDFEALDSFKEKKSIKIYKAIQEKTQNVPLEKQ